MFVTATKLLHVWVILSIGSSSVIPFTPLLASSSDLYDVASAVGGNRHSPLYSVPSK